MLLSPQVDLEWVWELIEMHCLKFGLFGSNLGAATGMYPAANGSYYARKAHFVLLVLASKSCVWGWSDGQRDLLGSKGDRDWRLKESSIPVILARLKKFISNNSQTHFSIFGT